LTLSPIILTQPGIIGNAVFVAMAAWGQVNYILGGNHGLRKIAELDSDPPTNALRNLTGWIQTSPVFWAWNRPLTAEGDGGMARGIPTEKTGWEGALNWPRKYDRQENRPQLDFFSLAQSQHCGQTGSQRITLCAFPRGP